MEHACHQLAARLHARLDNQPSAGTSKAATHGHFKTGQALPSCPDEVFNAVQVGYAWL
jgi:hypothetical protein